MNFWLSIQIGLREILAHKFRSLLTMFGIILGVASLISMFATVEGMTRGMREHLMLSGGVERISVIDQEVPVGQEDRKSLSPGRTLDDAAVIRRECPLVVDVSPEVIQAAAALQHLNKPSKSNVNGCTPSFLNVNNYEVERGRFITDLDIDLKAQVCVIGWPVWELLEQTRMDIPIGKVLKINEIPFRIVGVLLDYEPERERTMRQSGKLAAWESRAKERRSGHSVGKGKTGQRWNFAWWKNNIVLIPISTMQAVFKSASGQTAAEQAGPDNRLSNLNLKIRDASLISQAVEEVKFSLLKVHRGIEDFGFDTREDWADSIEDSVRKARLSGGIIAGISLIVGGIGIANIMLASITERVREIGIHMAVGARGRDIFTQVLIESSVLGFMGGLIGLAASFGVLELIKQIAEPNNQPVVTSVSMLISFAFAVATGIIAGIYPALKASRLNPIQALRYE